MKRAVAAMLACIMLSGCADNDFSIVENAETTSQTPSASATTTVASSSTTTAVSAAQTASTTTVTSTTTAETSSADPKEQQPDIQEGITYETVSDGHIFVDFDYITDYDKCSVQNVPDDIVEITAEAVRETDEYKASQRDLPEYKNNGIDEYLDANGELQPVMRYAFREDFDNSGSNEWFLLYDIPLFSSYLPDSFQPLSILVYTNGRDATVMTAYQGITEISLLDYGLCRHLLICGNGTYGAGCHSEIFGVRYGRAVEHYKFRGVFYKQDCFIAAHGWQSMGDFMYYDTVAHEYRAIKGKDISKAELQKMDSHNSLAEEFSQYDEQSVYPYANVIGGKYYLIIGDFFMDIGTPYTYENGEFIPCSEDCTVRLSRCHLINSVEDINYDEAISSMVQPEEVSKCEIWHLESYELTEVSPDNVFIDFDFIEEYKGERDPEKCADIIALAKDAILSSEIYEKYCAPLSPDMADEIDTYNDSPSAEEFFDENGKAIPLFVEAFSEDFDGDGTVENFVVMLIPVDFGYTHLRYVLVHINDSGIAEAVNHYYSYSAQLLDYGAFKHLIFGGSGYCGADSHTAVYGVENDSAKELIGLRGEYYKWECFLSADGWQASGDFMYFDTVAREYRAIAGELVPMETIAEMDSTGALADYINGMGFMFAEQISLIGGKYYVAWCGYMERGAVFTYENGKFVPVPKDCGIRLPGFMCKKAVKIEDIEEVIGSMISPEDALKRKQAEELPSDGHIFVDFSYIEDYDGTTDIAECGEWYDMAMTALKSSEAYTTYNTTLKNEDLSVIKYHESAFAPDITDYLDENGDIQPILSGAYIDDFDKNGQNECFLLLDIPQYIENPDYWITRSYLYFVNANGIKYLNDFSNIWEISMLDYGLCRQFIIRAYGTMGADEGALLYGVIDGEVVKHYAFRGGFTKVDCFINASGWMGFGDFMYYDTVRQQYRAVAYEHIPTQTILEMDNTGEFAGYYDDYEIDPNSLPWYLLVGEKYYCLWLGPSDIGTPYIYENGSFVQSTDNVRVSHGLPPIKINYDDAVSSMLSPAEAAVVYNAL